MILRGEYEDFVNDTWDSLNQSNIDKTIKMYKQWNNIYLATLDYIYVVSNDKIRFRIIRLKNLDILIILKVCRKISLLI